MSIPLETPQDGAEKPGVVLQLFRKQPGDENPLELLQDSADFPVLAKLRLDIDVKVEFPGGLRPWFPPSFVRHVVAEEKSA
jgi:hypothetical protein